jgi:hypothetical protein
MKDARLSLLAALAASAGCSTLQPVGDPARFISEARPQVVYATHTSGAVVAVARPRVSGDTLLGTREGLSLPVALPLSQVERVEAVQRDKKRTTLMIVGVTAVTATLGILVAQAGAGEACDYSLPPSRGGCLSSRLGR